MNRNLEEYLAYLSGVRNLSANTIESYRRDLALFDRFLEGNSPLEVSTGDLRLFIADLGKAGYEPSTLNRVLASIRGFCRFAVHFGLRADNPASMMRNLKVAKKLPVFLFANEAERLCALPVEPRSTENAGSESSLRSESPSSGQSVSLWPARDAALFSAMYTSGCRVSEIAGIRLFDLEKDYSSVIVHGKGGKDRRVFFAKAARKAIAEYLVERAQLLARAQENERGKKALFVSSRGNPLSVRGIQYILARYSDNASGLRHLSPHALRHSFATTLISRGADIRVVQELLGHASISTTQRYTHVTGDQLKKLYHRAHPHG